MSGMCERSAFDTFYHMDNDEKGLVTFYGFESSIIRYDTKERLWVLTIINKPDLCPPEKTQHCILTCATLYSHLCNVAELDPIIFNVTKYHDMLNTGLLRLSS